MGAPLGPLDAYEEVMRFAARRGEAALCLAMHAAVPQVLRLELVHLLHLNFVPESIDDPAMESDVLFAPFCESLGNGYYRFDAHARRHLVKHLDPHYAAERGQRSRRVASFLLSYFDEQRRLVAESNDVVYAVYLEVERWVALAFFDGDVAARQLASAVRELADGDRAAARFRLAGLSSAVATPFARHQALLAYTAGIEALEGGDVDRARDILEPLGDADVIVGGVALRSPAALLREWGPPEQESEPDPEPATESPDSPDSPASVDALQDQTAAAPTIFLSYSHRDEKWVRQLQIFLEPIARSYSLQLWSDHAIATGESWNAAISSAIDRARVAIVLVSQNYLASEFCEGQLQELARRAETRGLWLLWIAVSPCNWQHTPVAKFQAANDVMRPLSQLRKPQRERAFVEIVKRLGEILDADEPRTSPPTRHARIFLCYRRSADDGRAGRLFDRLTAALGEGALFYDVASVPIGTDFLGYITEAVNQAEVMLVVIGPDWLSPRRSDGGRRIDDEHDPMRFEIAAALQRDLAVIPLLVGGAPMPPPEALPPDLQPLAWRQAVVLSDLEFSSDVGRLLQELDGVMKGSRRSGGVGRKAAPHRERRSIRVFLSSTYEDLVAHRKAVVEALQKMPDIAIVAPYWVASDDRPLPGQLDDLASCDLLISIVAWRYGYVPPDPQLNPEDQSLTELAFHKAKEKNIPRLAFLAEREDWTASMMDEATGDGDKGRRVQAWRKLISVDTIAAPFSTPSELAMRVTQAVLQWMDSSRGGTPLPR